MLAVAALLVGCGGLVKYELPPTVAARVHASADLALRDYRRKPELPDPYARAIYCVENETLLEYDAGAVDAGTDIVCHPPPVVKPPPIPTVCVTGYQCTGTHCFCEWERDASF